MTRGFGSDVINQVQQASDIVDVVSESVALKRRGRKLWGLCPFHGEKTPSFTVDAERQLFYCFGCRAGGNVFGFVMQRDGRTFPEALRFLGERAGIEVASSDSARVSRRRDLLLVLAETQQYFKTCWNDADDGQAARAAVAARGLPDRIVEQFGLGVAPDRWDGAIKRLQASGHRLADIVAAGVAVERPGGGAYDRMRGRITFPIHDADGHIVGFGGRVLGDGEPKYLNSPETEVYQKGKILYGAHFARGSWRQVPPLVVEGYFDVMACHAAGLTEAVASLGTALTEDHARYLKRFSDTVVLCYDRDAAGVQAGVRAFQVLSAVGMSVRQMEFDGVKDVDELLRRDGSDAVYERARKARPYLTVRIMADAAKVRMDPEAKAHALQALKPMLAAVQDPVERQGYMQLVQRTWSIDQRILTQALRKTQDPSRHNLDKSRHNMGRKPVKIGLPQDEVNLLALLLQFPDQWEGVLTTLPELRKDTRWAPILERWLLLADEPLARWMQQLPDESQALVAEAAMRDLPAEPGALLQLAKRMQENYAVKRWNELSARAAASPDDPALAEEIRKLWSTIREAKQSQGREG